MSKFKTVYCYNEDGFFVGEGVAQRDKTGEWINPPMSTGNQPLSVPCVYEDGVWVEYVEPELPQEEIDARNAEIERQEAEALANAPYVRLAEIDILLTAKAPRMLEDLYKGLPLHSSVVALIEEKDAIRASLES